MPASAQSRTYTTIETSQRNKAEAVSQTLAELESLSTDELTKRFEALFGRPKPPHFRRRLLLQAVAYKLQENAYGGLSKSTQRRLAQLAKELRQTGELKSITAPEYKPGTRLLREWQGETHVVTVTHDGYLYQGERYANLSVIARTITGTHWSGPAFFGLRRKKKP